jgi:thioredoxin-like negative regulator of GroEL
MADELPVLAFFRSERSGPARRMESLIANFARKERERLRVTVVDVDTRPDLTERFRVTAVPTLILIDRRRVVGRLEGRASAPAIEQLLEAHLAPVTAAVPLRPAVVPA